MYDRCLFCLFGIWTFYRINFTILYTLLNNMWNMTHLLATRSLVQCQNFFNFIVNTYWNFTFKSHFVYWNTFHNTDSCTNLEIFTPSMGAQSLRIEWICSCNLNLWRLIHTNRILFCFYFHFHKLLMVTVVTKTDLFTLICVYITWAGEIQCQCTSWDLY